MPILMIVQVELGRGANYEEFKDHSQLTGATHFQAPMKFSGALETSTGSLPTLRAEIQLTAVTERSQDLVGPQSSQVLVERPPSIQQTPQKYHW